MSSAPKSHRSITVERDEGVLVAERGAVVLITVDEREMPAVTRAAQNLAADLEALVGARASTTPSTAGAGIVIGTIGVSPAVDAAIAARTIDVSGLFDDDGSPRWESFMIAVVDGILHLVGAERRGTVYAVYEFARSIGVSPWHWWADAPVHPRDHVTVAADAQIVDWPSVRYRGIFINDEEELYHWARRHTPDGTIGPAAYERLFELLLRLGGNYLWPAMHIGAFNDDPENGRLAHEMGIVIGSSHCDILLRSNNHEFHPWSDARPEPVRYDYSLEGANRESLRDYWRGSVTQNGAYEVTWTVGIRGVHDSGFETQAIDDDDALDDDAKFQAKVTLLEDAIHDQRGILAKELGVEPQQPPQLFIPYKEVLPLYDAGLQVPDDVTLVWANDNFGYIRRFPSPTEQERAGGHGLYYHSSYWSNFTTSYLATSSTPLSLMRSELTKAWEGGIRRLWVDNVGGLKPLEIETEFFLRSAWQAGRETTTASARDFVAEWVDATFSGRLGVRAADIYARYYRLNNQRKYEHLAPDVFSATAHGDEAGRRLAALRDLFDETNALMAELPADERDAFFQVFAVKIHMSYLANGEFVHADRSTFAHDQGRLAAADRHLAVSRSFGDLRRQLIHFYNHVMSGGRWNGMFTPEAFPPPVMPLFAPGTPALRIEGRGLGVAVWGAASTAERTLAFARHGRAEKWLDVFSTGGSASRFTVESDPWIEVSPSGGVVDAEQRLRVRVAADTVADGATGTIRILDLDGGDAIEVDVVIAAGAAVESGFSGWIESDGAVSIDPSRPDAVAAGSTGTWSIVPELGRYSDGALQARPHRAVEEPRDAAATATFGFHLTTSGEHALELHRLPSLDSMGRIRVGVSIDGGKQFVVESATTDEHRGTWSAGIQDNVESLRLDLPHLSAGGHTLTLHTIDHWFTLSKVVIYTAVPAPSSLGPEFSVHTEHGRSFAVDPDPLALDVAALTTSLTELYRSSPGDVAVPDQLYADREFWDGETTNRKAIAVAQTRRSAPAMIVGAAKDLLSDPPDGPLVEEGGVIAFATADALAGTPDAWLTADGPAAWVHTQAETAARTGIALQVRPSGREWHDPLHAPAINFTIDVREGGSYRVWLLLSFRDDTDDSCVIALDGVPQPVEEQFSRGSMCTYGIRQAWVWTHVSDLEIDPGHHRFSIHARESGLRIDRVYLTRGEELPPIDADWRPTRRASAALAGAPRT